MDVLNRSEIPFLVGGTHALRHHAGIRRRTKDLDLFLLKSKLGEALRALRDAGFETEVPYPHWLAKACDRDGNFVDLIFSSGNGISAVDETFFEHASDGTLFGVPVRWCPIEEMVWSKAYVMERERYDGADVAHLLHAACESIDWARLVDRFGRDHRVLFAHLILLEFIYPQDRARIPPQVIADLATRYLDEAPEGVERICCGTLLSREQFLSDLEGGYLDGRVTSGAMTEKQVAAWTAAIARTSHRGGSERNDA